MRVFLGIVALSLAVTGRVEAELIFQTVNVPGATSTDVTGVTQSGNEITGSYMLTQGGSQQGFLREQNSNQTSTVTVPGASSTRVEGISGSGNEIAGSFTLNPGGPEQGFILERNTNQTLTVNVPGAFSTRVEGISAAGNAITGSYTLTQGGPRQGFVATSVPEPSTLLLIVSGVLATAACAKRVRGATKMAGPGSRVV